MEEKEFTPRTVLIEVTVNDSLAIEQDVGTLDYVYSKMEALEGIVIENARVLDDDDPDDETAIGMMNAIFNHDENF